MLKAADLIPLAKNSAGFAKLLDELQVKPPKIQLGSHRSSVPNSQY